MRIFLLPISTRRTLLYCEKLPPSTNPNLAERAILRATKTWTSWEQTPKGWKRKTTEYGNALLRRIPFEEWSLKTLPALSSVTSRDAKVTKVLFPSQFLDAASVDGSLVKWATERQGFHRSRLIQCVLGMPLTIPFGLIPVLPNFPFLYLVFRAWSHWKALFGARYLDFLVKGNFCEPVADAGLDEIYAKGLVHGRDGGRGRGRSHVLESDEGTKATTTSPDTTTTATGSVSTTDSPPPSATTHQSTETLSQARIEEVAAHHRHLATDREVMLLHGWNARHLAEGAGLPEMEIEIERAVEQVERDMAAREAAAAAVEENAVDANAGRTTGRDKKE